MKILLFANTDWYLYNFRLDLIKAIQAGGHEVVLASPAGAYAPRMQELGLRWVKFPLSRSRLNPFSEIYTVIQLIRLYAQEKPDIVHHFTIKCVLYGSLAAHLIGAQKVVNSITGLGYVFMDAPGLRRVLQKMTRSLYRLALRKTAVIFQNPDDRSAFIKTRLVDPEQTYLIRGSGVDVGKFKVIPESEDLPIVILPGRLLWDKGVGEFVEAARLLKAWGIAARFILVGDRDRGNPSEIPAETLHQWAKSGAIEQWGWHENMPEIYAQANLICLPSYGEGLPKTLLEAAASGRAIVATDVPGCREIVQDRLNGLLVPPRDPLALARALQELIQNPSRRREMGCAGRLLAEGQFSTQHVIQQTLAVYQMVISS